ncbi:hypothetical protein K435DRAFT_872370, partial [Dendrothele bispora CBS 962.96]
KVASALAKKTKQPEPKGYKDGQEQLLIDAWKYHCSSVHDHPPSEQLPFNNPFDLSSQPKGPQIEREDEMAQTIHMTQILTLNVPSSSPSTPHPSPSKGSSSRGIGGTFAKAGPSRLDPNVRPSPAPATPDFNRCSPFKPAAAPPSPSKAEGGLSRSPSPSKRFKGSVDDDAEAVYPSSEEEEEGPIRFFVVRFPGGADFFSSSDEAFKALRDFHKQGISAAMRTTTDAQLAQDFADRA